MGIESVEALRRSITQSLNLREIKSFVGTGDEKREEKTVVRSIISEPGCGLVRSWMYAGEVFPRHDHDMRETFHVIRGALSIRLDDGTHRKMTRTQTYTFEPREAHEVRAKEDSDFLCVTMPRDPSYPG